MALTQQVNSKANVKKNTSNDVPVLPKQPVINKYEATSTAAQTVINLNFSVDTTIPEQFMLYIDGKFLRQGSTNDFTFSSVGSDNMSSQVTLNTAISAGFNIIALKLGMKPESEFLMDNRFLNLYESLDRGFQGFVSQSIVMNPTLTTGTPAAGVFYSSISNRAPMVDLSQDLKPRMAIERIPTQTLLEIQNEFGPAQERVFGIPNDTFNQVRFVGGWSIDTSTNGQSVDSSLTTDYLEVTFYGTGLNVVVQADQSGRTMLAATDGGSEGSNILTGTTNVIGARNYAVNQTANAIAGLTLGVHTVKVRTSGTAMRVYGIEVVNESSSVKVQPGISYNQGKKLTLSAQNTFAYNSVVTGTRGGRVLVYHGSDGTIGKAFQATNTSAAFLTSADHTNEEVAKTYSFREFGAGRADDFSVSGQLARAFTLDDGSTNLMGSTNTIVGTPSLEGIFENGTGGLITFTFVGTGLDIYNAATSATGNTYNVFVDGTQIATSSTLGATKLAYIKIASGLPYGTHTFRISGVTTGSPAPQIAKFLVYQPKKPTLPSGAVELADYNVMADFAVNTTAAADTVSTGVLRKHSIRELTYANGTGGSTDWTISALSTAQIGGWQLATDRQNAFFEYTFFGTGWDMRFTAASNRSANIQVSLQSLSTGGSLQNLTTTNFPTITSSVYGTGVAFNNTTGVLDQADAATSNGSGFRLSGLPVGLYKVKVLNNTASSFFVIDAIDIITPIHVQKPNSPVDILNTLAVGSCGISDTRKITPVKDVLPKAKVLGQAYGLTSGPTTNSTSPIPCPDMSTIVKLDAPGILDIFYSITANLSTSNLNRFQIYINGIGVGNIKELSLNTSFGVVADRFAMPVAAGTYKIDLFWWVNAGTATALSTDRSIVAVGG